MDERLEYELLNIDWGLNYDFDAEPSNPCVHDGDELKEKSIISYDENGIPIGNTSEDIKKRKQIIFEFYENWKTKHPGKTVFNQSLNADILIRQESVIEAAEHASKRYRSTLAVLKLDEVLARAKQVAIDAPKPGNKNQSKLIRMILMSYQSEEIGTVKLTVGVRNRSLDKIQYGITALEEGERILPAVSKKEKKKAPHKK